MTHETVSIVPETPHHYAQVEALLDEAFGPGRFVKTAYRLREGSPERKDLAFVAVRGGEVIGSVRFSDIVVGKVPALLLGPLVIRPAYKNQGHGLALMRAGNAAARVAGGSLIVLVGDAPYYARAGFGVVPEGRMRMPGPVDPGRLLALELEPGVLEAACGPVRPAPSASLTVPGDREDAEKDGEADQAGEQRQRAHAAQP